MVIAYHLLVIRILHQIKGQNIILSQARKQEQSLNSLFFAGGGKQKTEQLILIEDKDSSDKLGSEKDIINKKSYIN